MELQEFEKSLECLQKLVAIDPSNADGRAMLEKARKVRKDFQDN